MVRRLIGVAVAMCVVAAAALAVWPEGQLPALANVSGGEASSVAGGQHVPCGLVYHLNTHACGGTTNCWWINWTCSEKSWYQLDNPAKLGPDDPWLSDYECCWNMACLNPCAAGARALHHCEDKPPP